jgi:hypothetical protein
MLADSCKRVKLESILLFILLSSLKMDNSCFSEPSPLTKSEQDTTDLSVFTLEVVFNFSIKEIISARFSMDSYSLMRIFRKFALPWHKDTLVSSISAKQAPTIYSSFNIFLNALSAFCWMTGKLSLESESTMKRPPSLSLDVLKKTVLTTTPKESMYLMSVGKRGMMLYFCL